METAFDHLVVGAADLEQGKHYLREQLGVELPPGGSHPQMGTHNRVAALDNTSFIEIISIDPEAYQPAQPRWFGLDDPHVRAALAESPRLLTWVVSTTDITAILDQAGIDFGIPQPLRRGDLRWYFAVPEDGGLLAGGMLPHIISWQVAPHPASAMAASGCSLKTLRLHTPFGAWMSAQLESIGALSYLEIVETQGATAPWLEAILETPSGLRTLHSLR